VIGADGDPACGDRFADELRLMWNTRGAVDVARLETGKDDRWQI
jgi:hypothetical protein